MQVLHGCPTHLWRKVVSCIAVSCTGAKPGLHRKKPTEQHAPTERPHPLTTQA
jgi:hypothetical protein